MRELNHPGRARWAVLAGACLAVSSTPALAAGGPPKYLRDLDRAYHAGDWTLQCNSTRLCQIIGVAKVPGNGVGVRAVVMISRGIARNAPPRMRIAFVDSLGSLSVPQPNDRWRLYARGVPRVPPPLRLGLGAPDRDSAYRPAPAAGAPLISALRRWPGSVIMSSDGLKVNMPRGDLSRLFRRMERLQHPRKPRLSAQEQAQWLKEYHHVILRHSPIDDPVPDAVRRACDRGPYVNQPIGWRIGPRHRLWRAECPEGYKLFLQPDGKTPVRIDVRDAAGKVYVHGYAGMGDDSLLIVRLPKDGDDGCGRQLKLGFSGSAFLMIEDRRYDRCRAVPHDFWPLLWAPTRWSYADDYSAVR